MSTNEKAPGQGGQSPYVAAGQSNGAPFGPPPVDEVFAELGRRQATEEYRARARARMPGTPEYQQNQDDRAYADALARDRAKARLIAEKAGEQSGQGWEAVKLDAVLSGERQRVLPTLGRRTDDVALLYAGKEHSIASEPECGKTWWAALIVVEVLRAGGRVVYVDFEDSEDTIVGERLMPLGAPVDLLHYDAGRFRYHRPDRGLSADELNSKVLLTFPYEPGRPPGADLVVFDGVTEGMTLLGLNPLENTDVAAWRQRVVKPALTLGTATLSTDHVVKDRESRGRFAIGGQHKLAGLTGAQFLMEQVDPFGRGLKGRSRVLISKDRNGGLRQHGRPGDRPGLTYFGDLVGDASGGEMASLAFWPPSSEDDDKAREDAKLITAAQMILNRIKVQVEPPGVRDIEHAMRGLGKTVIGQALVYLIDQGCIRTETLNRKKIHIYVRDLGPVPGGAEVLSVSDLSVR